MDHTANENDDTSTGPSTDPGFRLDNCPRCGAHTWTQHGAMLMRDEVMCGSCLGIFPRRRVCTAIDNRSRPRPQPTTWPSQVRTAAARIGVPVDEYARHTALGDAWCSLCKTWKRRADFRTTSTGRRDRYCDACRSKRDW